MFVFGGATSVRDQKKLGNITYQKKNLGKNVRNNKKIKNLIYTWKLVQNRNIEEEKNFS
jgi:hypothetical protein